MREAHPGAPHGSEINLDIKVHIDACASSRGRTMFSQSTEYALRIVVYLGSLGDRAATISQIAQSTRVPAGYLPKVLRGLARAELVRSRRGPHGGSTLARPASRITIYDIVEAVDPIRRITTCPLGLPNHGVNLCPLHHRLDAALAMVEEAFRASTVADLLAVSPQGEPLCTKRAPGRPRQLVPLRPNRTARLND